MPLGDRPILDILLCQLQRNGFRSIAISTGYLATLIETFVEAKNYKDVEIQFVNEEVALGTAGPSVLPTTSSPFVMLNGDILADFNFDAFLETHKKAKFNYRWCL